MYIVLLHQYLSITCQLIFQTALQGLQTQVEKMSKTLSKMRLTESSEEIEDENQNEPERMRRITIVMPRDEQQEGSGAKTSMEI